jgi:hypothetical protein
MVRFRKGSVSGHRFSDAAQATILNGFKPPGLACNGTAAKAFALYLLLAACLKACPDTSLSSNCTITRESVMVQF